MVHTSLTPYLNNLSACFCMLLIWSICACVAVKSRSQNFGDSYFTCWICGPSVLIWIPVVIVLVWHLLFIEMWWVLPII